MHVVVLLPPSFEQGGDIESLAQRVEAALAAETKKLSKVYDRSKAREDNVIG